MKKKRILIASIIFILIICIVAAVFIVKNRNRSTSNTMYTYSNLNPEYNYSEDNVFYFDDSGILHLIDTASGKDMVYCDKPNCTHRSRNNGVVISRSVGRTFFRFNIRFYIQSPEFNQLWKNLVNREFKILLNRLKTP